LPFKDFHIQKLEKIWKRLKKTTNLRGCLKFSCLLFTVVWESNHPAVHWKPFTDGLALLAKLSAIISLFAKQ